MRRAGQLQLAGTPGVERAPHGVGVPGFRDLQYLLATLEEYAMRHPQLMQISREQRKVSVGGCFNDADGRVPRMGA